MKKHRHGYSDQTALQMARFSDLAYKQFEKTDDAIIQKLVEVIKKKKTDDAVKFLSPKIFQQYKVDRNIGLEALKECLKNEGFELVATFNNELTDTQAYLAKNIDGENASAAKTAVLAFRGTEKKAKDWITNFGIGNVRMVDGNREFQVHKGFYEAFKSSQKDIETHLAPLIEAGYKLYISRC